MVQQPKKTKITKKSDFSCVNLQILTSYPIFFFWGGGGIPHLLFFVTVRYVTPYTPWFMPL